jgi:hypothetical protein
VALDGGLGQVCRRIAVADQAVIREFFPAVAKILEKQHQNFHLFAIDIEGQCFLSSESGAVSRFASPSRADHRRPPTFRPEKRGDTDNDRLVAIKNRVVVTAPTWFFVVLCSFMMSKGSTCNFPECAAPHVHAMVSTQVIRFRMARAMPWTG